MTVGVLYRPYLYLPLHLKVYLLLTYHLLPFTFKFYIPVLYSWPFCISKIYLPSTLVILEFNYWLSFRRLLVFTPFTTRP